MAQSAVMYFMAKSRIHTVWPPENDQNVPYLSPWPVLNSAKKHTNSTAMGKFCGLAQNSVCRGKLWSLLPVDESEIWIQHTLIFVGQVPVSTQILHEVFFFLEVVIPIFNVFLISLGKCKALQTDRQDIQTDIAWHAYTQMYIALQT